MSIVSVMPAGSAAASEPRRSRAIYLGSEIFGRPAFGSNHPLSIMRHSAVLELLGCLGWLSRDELVPIRLAGMAELVRFHDRDYLEALLSADTSRRVAPEVRERYGIGTLENPLFPGVFRRASATVGGSIQAAELACRGHVVFHPSGGTHHGRRNRASGFCYMNDPVFAVMTFLDRGKERVLYVDLDAHHGDGVEDAFVDEHRVMTVSIHEENRWPYTGRSAEPQGGSARNLPVPRGVNDSELDYLLATVVLPLAHEFAADALVLCCGADCLSGDPLSGMEFSNVALWDAVAQLLALEQPTVILGGGGYNPWTLARYWAGLWGLISGREIPDRLPDSAISFMRTLECDLIDEEDIEEFWLTTLADSRNPGPVREAVKAVAAAAAPRVAAARRD